MFSQLRQAVEGFTPQQPGRSTEPTGDAQNGSSSRSNSMDTPPRHSASPLSSGQLAESALSSLRKSFASTRTTVPPMNKASSSPAVLDSGNQTEKSRPKRNLEERLRASLSHGDVSTQSTNTTLSKLPDLNGTSQKRPPSSPTSIPLPDSPVMTSQDLVPLATETDHQTAHIDVNASQSEQDGSSTLHLTQNDEKAEVKADTAITFHEMSSTSENEDTPPTAQSQASLDEPSRSSISLTTTSSEPSHETTSIEPKSTGMRHTVEDPAVEELQKRLKEVEQRFTDVSTSFKHLQSEKLAADAVLREMTPLTNVNDSSALKEYLHGLTSKNEVFEEEIKRLNNKLEVQEDRVEEMRETHRASSALQVDQIDRLQSQLRETEALFQQAQKAVAEKERILSQKDKDVEGLKSNIERLNTTVREEEEKRTKAISLLKTVRQKLVKAEKEKEDALKEVASFRDKERVATEQDLADKKRLERELENANVEKDRALTNMRMHHEKEIASLKERQDKELSAMRGQFELDAITTKSLHNKEIASKNAHITTLETSLNNVTREKNAFFEQLQLRQAETESAQAYLESVQHQNTELQYQLREANDRLTLLKEDMNEMQREQEFRTREPTTSAENIAHLLAATESKYETKLAELKRTNTILEKERNESEAEWSRKLTERGRELEEFKRLLGHSAKDREKEEETISGLKEELTHKNKEVQTLQRQITELNTTCGRLESAQASAKSLANDLNAKISVLEKQLEDGKARDTQLRQTNKSLREELRKVQSSAALLERQRNPGVGYWTTRLQESASPSETASSSPAPGSRVNSPPPESSKAKNEEEVNLEYLRNVILQFLEHKEMRPNLVKVLSIILHFTPQETRRLMAKV